MNNKNEDNNKDVKLDTNTDDKSLIQKVNNHFKMPIYYNKDKVELKTNIINDLELINSIDASSNPIYSYYFNNDNDISKKLIEQVSKYYTTDTFFLKDSQQLLKTYQPNTSVYTNYSNNYKNILDIWTELKVDTGFKEKYCYIDMEMLEFLNKSELFLHFMSIYNLISPVFSLLVPIIILLVPFFIIKARGLEMTINEYIVILKSIAQNNAIGKLFTVNFSEITSQEKTYMLVSAGFYLFSIYQNFMTCIKFHKNMTIIHNHFNEIKIYLEHTIPLMENYLSYSNDFVSYTEFNSTIREKLESLNHIYYKINRISEYNIYNINKIKELGHIFKYFYELHDDKTIDDALMFSLGFNGYIDCIKGLQQNIIERKVNYANFIKKSKKSNNSVISNSYYACLKDTSPVKNDIKFKKNMIITGPNAAGKTTTLKSTLINIIFTQQFGCGFYDSANLAPFKYIHCYLNIPDTSGRDSLFQAEARRCKEILDIISAYKEDSHFCAFDELYSGTNPEEAESSASAFMKYITKNSNVSCLLTTHFIKVCKKLDKNKNILNCHMVTKNINNKLEYTYVLKPGISEVKGGKNVLTEMNYPKEILDDTN